MDLDTNELKRILESIKDGQIVVGNGVINIDPCGFDLQIHTINDHQRNKDIDKFIYHFKILMDKGFIDGKLKFNVDSINFGINSLTLEGHNFLRELENETFSDKVRTWNSVNRDGWA